jgi:hypothetical protein
MERELNISKATEAKLLSLTDNTFKVLREDADCPQVTVALEELQAAALARQRRREEVIYATAKELLTELTILQPHQPRLNHVFLHDSTPFLNEK